jgi:hypothetical protein
MPVTSRDIMSIQVGLKQMWEKGYFDICTINRACKLLNLVPQKNLHNQLSLFHCVDYADLDTQTLKELKAMVVELFDFDRVMDPVIDLNPGAVLIDHTGSRTLTEGNILGYNTG